MVEIHLEVVKTLVLESQFEGHNWPPDVNPRYFGPYAEVNWVFSEFAESQIADSLQSENQQYDNKYLCPDCRHMKIYKGFN